MCSVARNVVLQSSSATTRHHLRLIINCEIAECCSMLISSCPVASKWIQDLDDSAINHVVCTGTLPYPRTRPPNRVRQRKLMIKTPEQNLIWDYWFRASPHTMTSHTIRRHWAPRAVWCKQRNGEIDIESMDSDSIRDLILNTHSHSRETYALKSSYSRFRWNENRRNAWRIIISEKKI